jgi:hypothetical protein
MTLLPFVALWPFDWPTIGLLPLSLQWGLSMLLCWHKYTPRGGHCRHLCDDGVGIVGVIVIALVQNFVNVLLDVPFLSCHVAELDQCEAPGIGLMNERLEDGVMDYIPG